MSLVQWGFLIFINFANISFVNAGNEATRLYVPEETFIAIKAESESLKGLPSVPLLKDYFKKASQKISVKKYGQQEIAIDNNTTETKRLYDEEFRERDENRYRAQEKREEQYNRNNQAIEQAWDSQVEEKDWQKERNKKNFLHVNQPPSKKGFWQDQVNARLLQRKEKIEASSQKERLDLQEKERYVGEQKKTEKEIHQEKSLLSEGNAKSFWERQEKERNETKRRATSVQYNIRRYGPHAPTSSDAD
ncbi:hypothetical protein PHSC3_001455 [Chlamydiales bacterium STE3]|nr:hypothetical protein PHSC3_001455 [Chlamydiales bacterium STE3]